METLQATEVQKEDVPNLHFPKEALSNDLPHLRHELARAVNVGNTQKQKVRIYFRDTEGLKMTNTTIWAVTEKNILLKQGVYIPIHRIVDVSLY